jgi:predicted ATPase
MGTLCKVLVGRRRELEALERFLNAARAGQGGLVLLAGEAGSGKTRLAAEFADRAGRTEVKCLRGGCSEVELPVPYLPFIEAIGNQLDGADMVSLRASIGPAANHLARLFPQFGEPHQSRRLDDQQKPLFFESIVILLEQMAKADGLLLVIEDIHWADTSSRELLAYLQRRERNAHTLVLASYRTDELHRDHPLRPFLASWGRSGIVPRVDVGPLTKEEVHEMTSIILDRVEKDMVDVLHARSEGNAFVVEELLREHLDHGGVADHLPQTVRDAIKMRVDRLDQGPRRLLEVASVIGPRFNAITLAAVADQAQNKVLGMLDALVDHQLLAADPDIAGAYRFRHALTRDAIHGGLPLSERRHLHLTIAADLEQRPDANSLEICRHLLGAGRTEHAIPFGLRAATEAMNRYAYSEAAALFEEVLLHHIDQRDRATALASLGVVCYLSGRLTEGSRHFDDAAGLFDLLGDLDAAADARVDAAACYRWMGRLDIAQRLCERAIESLALQRPSPPIARAWAMLALLTIYDLQPERANQLAGNALQTAEAAHANTARLDSYQVLGVSRVMLGSDEGVGVLDRAYEEGRQLGLFDSATRGLFDGVIMRCWL